MEAVDFLLEPWRSGIGRRALFEVVLLGGLCGALGFWVISFRLTYGAESLAHGLLPGLVLAALVGAPLVLGAGAGAVLAAGLIALAARDERIGPETAVAVAVSGLLGLGALLALTPDAPPRLEELLFGDPLAASTAEVAVAAGLVLAGGAALAALHRPLTAVAVDPAGAGALGMPPGRVSLALLVLLALTLTAAVQALGNLLVLAAVVGPAVAVRSRAAGPGRSVLTAGGLAALAGVVGIYASFHVGAAAGACVALALCATAATGVLLPRRRPT